MSPDEHHTTTLPASFAQELLYLVYRSAPDSTAYNVPRIRRLRGALDVQALERALNAIVARHEILRTTYALHEEHPVQVVHEARAIPFDVLDLSEPTVGGDVAVEQVLRERSARPFDLGSDVLLRATLIRKAPDEHVLLLESHHIAFDGWSRDILFRELDAFYREHVKGEKANLADLPIQYADFGIWQREQLSGERLDRLIGYWRTALEGAPFTLEVAADRARTARPGFESTSIVFRLDDAVVEAAASLARANNATLYMVLLSTYMAVLQRWSGQSDVLVGSPVAGRARPETEGLIGYFANTVVQRGRFANDPTFQELLAGVRDSTLGAFDHQEVPFERLVLELAGAQDASRSPIFQVVFTQLGVQGDDRRAMLGDVSMDTFAMDMGVTKFDLTLLFSQRPSGVELTLRYRTALFSDDAAARFVDDFRTVLAAAVGKPGVRLSTIDLLSDAEHAELRAWNDTQVNEGAPATLVSMFDAQAARVPDRTAVVGSDAVLTYADLNAQASRLAQKLVLLGVEANQPVGLLLDRTARAVVGLVGIMKAGGAYAPLSTDAPPARLSDQVLEAGIRVVVTDHGQRTKLPSGVHVIALDTDELDASPAGDWQPRISPAQFAYVLFTSGSTGTPKGVAVTHGNAVHYTRAVSRVLAGISADVPGDGLSKLDGYRFGLMSTLAADLGNTSLFPCLAAGGTLVVLDKAAATEPERFAALVEETPLDILKTTPNHLEALVTGRRGADLAAVLPRAWVVLGGEALRFDFARTLLAANQARVLNHYGPTETTVGVLTNEVTTDALAAAEAAGAAGVPLGRPLANTRAYVLSADRMEQPVGVVGELYVGGDGVTSGYVGRDDLTRERFDEWNGQRLYRTGDRVRRLADGTIEFLGRADDQVKIRGYRVELGEIERTLRGHPGVDNVVVLLDNERSRLIAYVIARPSGYAVSHGDRPTVQNLTELAASRLPDYMVPAAVVFLSAIPLTANAKLDRAALPAPESDGETVSSYTAPSTDTEEKLARIWCEVLKKDKVGSTDNFLELGGHSLFAIRVLGKISKVFGVRLPLRTLFDAPTIRELGTIVDMEARLAALEGMSDEDATKLLASLEAASQPTSGA